MATDYVQRAIDMLQDDFRASELAELLEKEHILAVRDATLDMAVSRLGGIVEGHRTSPLNLLQRIDELREKERRLAEVEAANRWIPCNERMPEDPCTQVLVFARSSSGYTYMEVADQMSELSPSDIPDVTHWRPLPPAPSTMN